MKVCTYVVSSFCENILWAPKNALNTRSFLKLKRLSYIVCHGDSNFPHLISPINAGDQRYDSATFLRLASQCALLHTEGIADGIKLKLLRIFGSHTFFHKLVPIKYWKWPKIKYYELFIIILTINLRKKKLFLLRANCATGDLLGWEPFNLVLARISVVSPIGNYLTYW